MNRYVRGWVGRASALGLAAIEVHRTACIVTHPPGGEHANRALVNPANEQLVGTRFTPAECWTNLHGDPVTGRWDKEYATYPHQAIDGLVSEFGGEELRMVIDAMPADATGRRCPVGAARVTPACHELRELYTHLIHTATPSFRTLDVAEWERQLSSAYHAALDTAHAERHTAIAMPLLGAGAKGAPVADAMRAAAMAAVSWRATDEQPSPICRFGVQSSSAAHALVDALEDAMAEVDADFELQAPPPADRWTL